VGHEAESDNSLPGVREASPGGGHEATPALTDLKCNDYISHAIGFAPR